MKCGTVLTCLAVLLLYGWSPEAQSSDESTPTATDTVAAGASKQAESTAQSPEKSESATEPAKSAAPATTDKNASRTEAAVDENPGDSKKSKQPKQTYPQTYTPQIYFNTTVPGKPGKYVQAPFVPGPMIDGPAGAKRTTKTDAHSSGRVVQTPHSTHNAGQVGNTLNQTHGYSVIRQPDGHGGPGFVYSIQTPSIDPESAEFQKADLEMERKTRELSDRMHRTVNLTEQDDLRTQLKKVVEQHFTLRQERRESEVRRLEEQLERLRKSTKLRADSRDSIIKKRIAELVGEQDEPAF